MPMQTSTSIAAMERKDDEEGDPLCCCEYINAKGERSHLLALFCDCEEIDESCDRLLQGQRLDSARVSAIRDTVLDRVRIPMFLGQGARRIDDLLDTTAIPPMLAIPLWLFAASRHVAVTALSFLLVPLSAIIYYLRILKRKQRTQFFVSVTLVSVFSMYFVFSTYAVPLGNISPFEHALLTINLLLFLASFGMTKRGPGFVRKSHTSAAAAKPGIHPSSHDSTLNGVNISKSLHRRNNGASESAEDVDSTSTSEPVIGQKLLERDNGTNVRQELKQRDDWCDKCQWVIPSRAGHCRICGRCVHCLDHHCVWIDCCVGRKNHRAFIISLLLFFIGGSYGAVRAANIIYGRLAFASSVWEAVDIIFSEEGYAIMFVSVLYACFACPSVLALLLQQCHLVTHNWTYRERKRAARVPGGREYLAGLDEGFVVNWTNFITGDRGSCRHAEVAPTVV